MRHNDYDYAAEERALRRRRIRITRHKNSDYAARKAALCDKKSRFAWQEKPLYDAKTAGLCSTRHCVMVQSLVLCNAFFRYLAGTGNQSFSSMPVTMPAAISAAILSLNLYSALPVSEAVSDMQRIMMNGILFR